MECKPKVKHNCYQNPRSSAGNWSWRLFPSSNIFLSLDNRKDPSGLFSFKISSESWARPIEKIPSKANFCKLGGRMEQRLLFITRCTATWDVIAITNQKRKWTYQMLSTYIEGTALWTEVPDQIAWICNIFTWVCNSWVKAKSGGNRHGCPEVFNTQRCIINGNLKHPKDWSHILFHIKINRKIRKKKKNK